MNLRQPDPAHDELIAENAAPDPELLIAELLADPSLSQHVTRHKRDGMETIVGYFRIMFAIDQQRTVLHVPFSPAFEQIPSVDAIVTEDSPARVRITDRQKFGTRIEIILPQAAKQETIILVEVIATCEH